MPSESGSAWSPPASTSERRLSNSSDGSACSGYSKTTTDSADFLATRPHTAAVIPGKPAANPLQFIRVGPADLGSRAREQLRRAELAKKTEPAKLERQEDWQSNLDNWKSSRRKRVEHIIERCVEVRRMETETGQPRAKSKTFNEMLEERAGRRRKNHLAYLDEDGHDLSDLGIGTSSTKSSLSEDCDNHSLASDGMDLDKNHSDVDNMSNCDNNRKLGSSANEYDTCTTTTISSPEPEEYTYESAIEGYKSRIISQTNSNMVKTLVINSKETSPEKNSDLNRIRTSVSNKIEEKVSSFQQERTNDARNFVKKDLPKVDIHKRREQFERENSQELQINKPKIADINNKKSIKERLSSLEKFTEETHIQKSTSDLTKLPTEVRPLKERLSSLEKVKSAEPEKVKRLSNGDLGNTRSLKERLNSLKSQTSEEEVKSVKTEVKDVSMSLKERLSCLDAAKNKEIPKILVDEQIHRSEKISETKNIEDSKGKLMENSLKSSLTGIESQMQSFCRSLDSLDTNGQSSPNSFERVQSLEDFDCAEMQNNTVPSDIETEDSGIHTARDSCAPADDIADLSQVASPIGEPMIEASEYESSNEDSVQVELKIVEEKIPEHFQPTVQEVIAEEAEDQDSKADDDSTSNYTQAVSQQLENSSATEEVSELHTDKDDEDTLKSLENQDTSVIDALELAFKELDSEDSANMEEDTSNKTGLDLSLNEKISVTPLYENIDIFYQNTDEVSFPLDMPSSVMEPPKEKPPPPPTEDVDGDELLGNGNFKHTNSTRRIKKEIRNKRTSFLGIEGQVDDSYLDADLSLAPRPDITSFLQEETKIEKLLYKKTLSHDMDAKLRDSRDSGVDVDRGPSAEAWYKGQSSPETSNPHSRQNSEPYTHVTITSDEEEIIKKQNGDFTNNLNTKLAELKETSQSDDSQIENLDKKLQQQQARHTNDEWRDGQFDDAHTKEVLRFERELLQLEQEELSRQREKLIQDQNRIIQKSVQDVSVRVPDKTPLQTRSGKHSQNYRHSMPNLLLKENYTPITPVIQERSYADEKRKPFVSEEHIQRHFGVEESRRVLYDERVEARRQTPVVRVPQPVLPPKPKSRESIEREITMRSSRVPSAVEYVNVERNAVLLRSKQPPPPAAAAQTNGTYHPMTRHTLQALSAAPTPKLMSNCEWMQARTRKPYNYNQHWLIQEAEHRRIEEQRSRLRTAQRHSYHQDVPNTLHNTAPLSNSHQFLAQEVKRTPREEKLLSVSGKRKCSHCGEELGRGAAMIIESLSLCYHVWCFRCGVCGAALGDGRAGTDVRVRGRRLHCPHCYSDDGGDKYSRV